MPWGKWFIRHLTKVYKNLKRSLLFWRKVSPGEIFVKTSESTHLKYIRAEFW